MRRIEDWPVISFSGGFLNSKKSTKLKYHRFGKYCLGGLGPLVKNDILLIMERKLYFEELL